MRTLIICDKYVRALEIAQEFDILPPDFTHMSARMSSKDVLTSHRIKGVAFGRAIYDGVRPSDELIAFLSLYLKDGAFLVNYKNYKLKRTLENL